MSLKLVDVSKLQDAATVYDKALRSLPYIAMAELAAKMKFNVMELQGKHALINERRRAGGTQSYKPGKSLNYISSLLGYEPSTIEPRDVVFITKENSKKYTDNELLVVGGTPVDNKNKKHPLEQRVVFNLVRSHVEDVACSLFLSERDDDSNSPAGCMDGIFTHVDKLIVLDDINAARGNYAPSGAFTMPTSNTDYAAYENLVEWIGGSHNFLRSDAHGISQLICSETVLIAARAALRNKLQMQEYPSMSRMLELLREDAMCPNLVISADSCVGKGSRLILQKVGNIDVAFNSKSAQQFVQIRDIYEDPNEWQFWLQAGYDTRLRDWHEKVFRTNEQTNTLLDLSGDYCNTGAVMVNITGPAGAKWTVEGKVSSRISGQYILGLTPGDHKIVFTPVEGYTTPADITFTVVAGKVNELTATYTVS